MNASARVLHDELFRTSVHTHMDLCVGKFEEMGKIIEYRQRIVIVILTQVCVCVCGEGGGSWEVLLPESTAHPSHCGDHHHLIAHDSIHI